MYAISTFLRSFAVALLAVFDVIPKAVAQYAPLAVVPFILRNRQNCCGPVSERRS